MRKLLVFAMIVMVEQFAAAQIPTSGNVFLGYSYYNTNLNGNRNSLNGWEGTVEGKVLPHIGIVADFSGGYGSENFATCNGFDCVLIDTHIAGSDTSFASGVGGGLDYRLVRLIAWRIQGDYLHTDLFSTPEHNVRISTGIVVKF